MYRSSLHFLSLAYKTPKNGGVDVNLLNQMNGQQRHSSNGDWRIQLQVQFQGSRISYTFLFLSMKLQSVVTTLPGAWLGISIYGFLAL